MSFTSEWITDTLMHVKFLIHGVAESKLIKWLPYSQYAPLVMDLRCCPSQAEEHFVRIVIY